MTRLLWITNMANPDPRAGGGLRSLRLVQAVSARWPVDVINLGEGLDEQAYMAMSGARSVRQAVPDVVSAAARVRLAVRRGLPFPACRWHSAALYDEVLRAAQEGDLVVLEHGWMLTYLPPQGRVLVVLHNVDREMVRDLPASGARRLTRRWNVQAYRGLERRLARQKGTFVTVVSRRDAQLMHLPHAAVVPNGADVPAVPPAVPTEGPVLFIGSMGYQPNVDAVRWWAREVWPGTGLPPLTVLGQGAGQALHDLHGAPAVRLVGEVADVAPWLARARVVAIPITSGSGTRLKVVEALAHGRPVVSTTKGAEGIGLTSGEHALLEDSAGDFGRAVRRLLDDDALCDKLSARGHALASGMSWPIVGEVFAQVVAEAIAAQP